MLHEALQIERQIHRPVEFLGISRMLKTEFGRVQGQSRGVAVIGNFGAVGSLAIYRFAADGVALLREVDANLMSPTRFQHATEDREFAESFRNCCSMSKLMKELGCDNPPQFPPWRDDPS